MAGEQRAARSRVRQCCRSAPDAPEGLNLAPTSQGVASEAALAFAMAGETARAESLAKDLNSRYPLDTQMQSLWLPAIQAQLALDRRNPGAALNVLQAASSNELGQITFVSNLSCLYDIYIRGEAYLAARARPAPRAAEFQKISTTAASSGTVGREHWPIWAWLVRTPCRREPRKERMPTPPASGRLPPTKIFLRSGKTLILTSPS